MGWIMEWTRKAGTGKAGANNMPMACYLGCGRVHEKPTALRKECWRLSIFRCIPFGLMYRIDTFVAVHSRTATQTSPIIHP